MESRTHDRSLGSDMMMEILTRTSLETVARCRTLSKECNSLTYEPKFKNLLAQRTNISSGFILQSKYYNKCSFMLLALNNDESTRLPITSLDFLPHDAEIKASTRQGIILFTVEDRLTGVTQFYVCKPTTSQCQRIPNPKTRYYTNAAGMIVVRTKPLHYKIVRFSEVFDSKPRQHRSFCCDLFDSQTFEWKQLPQVNLPPQSCFNPWDGPVLASGTLHWLTTKNIVSFQANNESWTVFSVPPHLKKPGYEDFKLVEYGGKLGFLYMGGRGSFMEVWVMEQRTWYKKHNFDLEFFTKDIPYWPTLVGYYPPGIVVMKAYSRLFLIYPRDARYVMKKEFHYQVNSSFGAAFQLESDFEMEDFPSDPSQGEQEREEYIFNNRFYYGDNF